LLEQMNKFSQFESNDSENDFAVFAPDSELVQTHEKKRKTRLRKQITQRIRRLDASPKKRAYAVPVLIFRRDDGSWWIEPGIASRVDSWQLAQAKTLYELGLKKKSQRQLACGLLCSVVTYPDGHRYKITYECGHRY